MVGSELDTGGTKERCSGLEYDEPPSGNHPPLFARRAGNGSTLKEKYREPNCSGHRHDWSVYRHDRFQPRFMPCLFAAVIALP